VKRTTETWLVAALLLAACGRPVPAATAAAGGTAATPTARTVARAAAPPATRRPGNFTVLSQGKAALGAARPSPALPRGTAAAPVHLNAPLGVPSFMWAQPAATGSVASTRAAARPSRSAVEAARAHLAGAAAAYRLGARDVDAATAARVHDTGRGPVIVTFKQRPGGVEVFGEEASVLMARDLSLVAISGALSPAAPAGAAGGGWALDAPAALAAALSDLSGEVFEAGDLVAAGRRGHFLAYDLRPAVAAARAERLPVTALVRQVWFRLPGGLAPAWQVEASLERLGDGETLTYGSVVSAADGALLFRKDHREDEAFAYRVWASDAASLLPDDGPHGLAGSPHPTGLPDGYQAPFVDRALVTLSSLPFSRGDPWLPPGATTTFGNNAIAYADLAAPNHFDLGDVMGAASAPGAFDWAYDLGAAPAASTDQVQAAITQLFYVGNALHDWFYDVGFDEAAGNAQNDNYGRGGQQGDPLWLEAQDYSGLDNANMTTPADGTPPYMQMFLWRNGDRARVVVDGPPAVAGIRRAQVAAFGPQAFDLPGRLAPAVPALACSALCDPLDLPASPLLGRIALVDRGTCTFVAKVQAAQACGATGVLVRNVLDSQVLQDMGGTDATIAIPSMLIGKADGDAIGGALAAGGPVDVSLQRWQGIRRDGTIDGLVVAHEWGHYLTNRLVQDSVGLVTTQARGMGEGWSDFVALLLAVRAEDAEVAANAGWSGVYAVPGFVGSGLDATGTPNQGFYYGIRRTPYSTDMTRAPLTFRHVADGQPLPAVSPPLLLNGAPNSEVHNAGEVWATALWECYAALLRDTQGAPARLTFDEASLRMREYLVASLKLLPQYPTFLEARDALLAVARAGDRADYAAFWAAFAKRGFGLGAVAPARFSTTNAGVVESFSAGGQLAFVSSTFGGVTSGCDDRDGTLDEGEVGTLSITLRNQGAGDLPAGTATITSGDPSVSFPDGGLLLLAPTPLEGTSVTTVRAALAGAAPLQVAQLTITLPSGYLALPEPVVFPLRTDQDALRDASATDTLEGDTFAWTPGALVPSPLGDLFQRVATGAGDHLIHGPAPEGAADLTLTSPPLVVGPGAFTVGWRHLFGFEADPEGTPGRAFYDGGVVELSDDGGATWRDVGGPAYNGALTVTGLGNPLEGRAAFVADSPSAGAGLLDPVTLDLTSACAGGTACAGRTVLLRFRIGSDAQAAGPHGWRIDDVAFGGITNTPFDLVVADARRCVNRPPVASAGADQLVDEGSPVALDASASSDLDAGTTLSYAWSQASGPAVALQGAGSARPTFVAPAVDADAVLAFQVTVDDGAAASVATALVTVRHVNRRPVADAGAPQAVDERTLATLDGSASSDADPGTVLGYAWTQLAGAPVTLLGPGSSRPSFVAPEVTADTVLTFQLVVGDGRSESAPATVDVTVRQVNRPPLASAGPLQAVDEGASVTLDASGSGDPDAGTALTYLWTQVAGPAVALSDPATAAPTFTAPAVAADALLTFAVAVSDGVAGASATVDVLVRQVNQPPTAAAGADQQVDERSLVTLDGSASADPDGGAVLAWAWAQVSGPAVALLGADGPRPSFTAPEVGAAGATLTFALTVGDGQAASPPATVTVSVRHLNRAPTASAGAAQGVDEGASVTLDGSGSSDPDAGTALSFLWTQLAGPAAALSDPQAARPSFTAPQVTASTLLRFSLTVGDGQATSTATVDVLVRQVNQPPVARAVGAVATPERTLVTLDGSASSDPDAGTALAWAWTQVSGPPVSLLGADGPRPTFTAPEVGAAGATLAFSLTVSDGQASSAPAGVTVAVEDVNRAPTASAGATQAADEGATVTLDGSGSSDPDAGATLSFLWTQLAGPAVTLSDPTAVAPTFTAPAVDAGAVLTFRLAVGDGAAGASATVDVLVRDVNHPPTAVAAADPQVDERALVTLDGAASSDPDAGSALAFAWSQVSGPAVTLLGADGPRPSFSAPEVEAAGATLVFSLTVSDGRLQSTPATVQLQVADVNLPPVAHAGPPQAVASGAEVSLDGRASVDPDPGSALAFAWAQAGGPPVALRDPATATPSFVAPEGPASLTFLLTVSDGAASSTATVVVAVAPPRPGGGGCGCSAGGGDPAALVPLLLGLGLLRRRRFRPAPA
jgi:large repetitive protein